MTFTLGHHLIAIVIAIVLQSLIFLALLVPFALPNLPAWQAAAFIAFMVSLF